MIMKHCQKWYILNLTGKIEPNSAVQMITTAMMRVYSRRFHLLHFLCAVQYINNHIFNSWTHMCILFCKISAKSELIDSFQRWISSNTVPKTNSNPNHMCLVNKLLKFIFSFTHKSHVFRKLNQNIHKMEVNIARKCVKMRHWFTDGVCNNRIVLPDQNNVLFYDLARTA